MEHIISEKQNNMLKARPNMHLKGLNVVDAISNGCHWPIKFKTLFEVSWQYKQRQSLVEWTMTGDRKIFAYAQPFPN